MDGETGESMEEEEETDAGCGVSESLRLAQGCQRELGSWFQCNSKPIVNFPAVRHHRPLTGTNLYCLVTEANV